MSLYIGDVRDGLRTFTPGSAQTCVTSPPYWGLRDYGTPGQIGLEPTIAEYVANMVDVFRLVREVLADDGTVFLNLGDSYFGGGRGGGGSFESERRGLRAMPCDTSDTVLANSQSRDCLCGSLCDVCRKAYRIGKSHSDGRRVPMPKPLPSATNHAYTGSQRGHLPTSDLLTQADHIGDATLDSLHCANRGDELLRASPQSMNGESSLLLPAGYPQSDRVSGCRLCGCSLPDCVPASADMAACNCDTSRRVSASDSLGTDVLDSAYPYLTTKSLKPKDLCGVPWRVAFALQADGWYLRSDIIWAKPNPMPESVTDRPTKAHEYLFLLAKSERYYYDAAAIAEPSIHAGEFRSFADPCKLARLVDGPRTNNGNESPGAPPVVVKPDRNRRTVWTIATEPYADAHFATFPTALVEPCIMAGSRVGDVVLDPFLGSGTVAQVAQALGRRWIGCELNSAYARLIERRTAQQGMAFA